MMTEANTDNHRFDVAPAASSLLSSVGDIEDFAREYFMSEFPNPSKTDCPMLATLRENARSGKPPDDGLRSHLFSCSDCFNQFRRLIQGPVASETSKLEPSWRRLFAPVSWPAFSALALVIAIVGVLLLTRPWQKAPNEIAQEQANVPGKTLPTRVDEHLQNSNSTTPTVTASQTPEQKQQQPTSSPVEMLTMTTRVDLRNYHALSGGEREAGTPAQNSVPIRLAAARTQLHLTLPQDSGSGRYVVSILDRASLKPRAVARAFTSEGDSVRLVLSLNRLQPGEYVLRVAPEGESPSNYRVFIHSPQR